MFHKKYTVKKTQLLSRKGAKQLREKTVALFVGESVDESTDELTHILHAIWDEKDAVSSSCYQFNSGVTAVLYFVNDKPLLVSLSGFPTDAEDLLPKRAVKGDIVPTVLFLRSLRHHFRESPERFSALLDRAALGVFCHGKASHILSSGAHLMIPGIRATSRKNTPAGSLAFVFSPDADAPDAVGLCTSKLANDESSGVGVYVINCFGDPLWQKFEGAFAASCCNVPDERMANPLPPDLPLDTVPESPPPRASEPQSTGTDGDAVDTVPAEEVVDGADLCDSQDATDGVGDGCPNAFEGLFTCEDDILSFAFFEAVKAVRPSVLPLPLTEFVAMMVNAYPRVDDTAKPIDFKKTKHKQALAFLKGFEDVVKVYEGERGVYSVIEIDRSALSLRSHNQRHREFLETVQKPATERESLTGEMRLLADKKAVLSERLLSVKVDYRLLRHTKLPDDLARVLLEGDVRTPTAHKNENRLPTLEEAYTGVQGEIKEADELPSIDEVYSLLFPRKAVADALRAYVRAHELLVANEEGGDTKKTQMPFVRLQGALSLYTACETKDQMPLKELEELILKRHFKAVTNVVMQTNVCGSSDMSELFSPRCITIDGLPPQVSIWVATAARKKHVTIVNNLKALGFNVDALCRLWAKRFSASCGVFHPEKEMGNLKSNKKYPEEIRLQGNVISQLSTILTNELGIPPALVSVTRKA